MLESLVTSKTRIKLLLKFFSHQNSGYLRSLAKDFDESTNSVRVELNRLTEAGLLVSEEEGKTKVYKANNQHPFFAEIKNMVSKFLGLDDLMERIVKRMGEVEKAYIIGDYAHGIDSGTVNMILIGKNLDQNYLNFIKNKTYEKVQRKVEVSILDEDPGNIAGILVYGA
ncbi:MAG TPA: PaaX family transcriptional regulator [Algoriphagus sp.]|uniref:winged helix-turn-helix domain-containing protein n=1 Tax=unclassified Algoriphagus TaxID=2641541 RepID=UPI000C5C6F45|nr:MULTISPECIES: winged helix-turn-helix domain-containing protein [unclassified Algoriphagus]MAL14025.1 PaaX family transcriptional regulator [Algoriphagus sp.]MAN85655.1 PaaX family transcriptional regulator [Algoriphagus sp.]QYH37992.1 winged helix-turn-helix transcriptional regulator [Algoriphagus sp. NBT04N3]HAD51114.1 PaaX family transcriptional regulator [Algoriphagus sp.]HAH37420.1 PaaX family transcriptional regulator [Algoriphagus sp.]